MEIFKNSLTKIGKEDAATSMSGIQDIKIGPPAQYGGDNKTLNPEELFVASINSCIMLVFYHFLKKYELDVCRYQSNAEGVVEKTKDGLRFTKVLVKAEVELESDDSAHKITEVAKLAEKYCLVSNSVSCLVEYSVSLNFRNEQLLINKNSE
jgi:organic hydroperoxide reductase OsmC/OhrA